jgi:hypothetical protein
MLIAALMIPAQMSSAQSSASKLLCFDLPPPLLAALRQYQKLRDENLDVEAARSTIRSELSRMIRVQLPSESKHNAEPTGLPPDSELWRAGATCQSSLGSDRAQCALVYYDKLWLTQGLPGTPDQMVRIAGWLVPFDFSPREGGASLALGTIVSLGSSHLVIECPR